MARPNGSLRHARQLRGWTLDDVAERLHRAMAEGGDDLGVDAHMVGRWERGLRRPYPRYVRLLTQVYGMSADALGLVETFSEEDPKPVTLDDMKRRQVLLAMFGLPLMDWPNVLAARVEPELLSGLTRLTRSYIELRRSVGVDALEMPVLQHLALLKSKLDESMTADVRQALLVTTAETATLAGRNALQLGQVGNATEYRALALQLADQSENVRLQVTTRLHMAGVHNSRPEDRWGAKDQKAATALIDQAVHLAGPRAHPQLVAATRAMRAEQAAIRGDASAAIQDLDVAEEAILRHGHEFEDGLLNPTTAHELAAIRGAAFVLLRAPAEAVPALELAHREMAAVHRSSWPGTVLADLGVAYAQMAEPDQAVTMLGASLDLSARDGSRFNRRRVEFAAGHFLGSVDTSAVQELRLRLAQ